MAPPVGQKYLVQVEKSKTRTIKFKNGFPPKIIKSRNYLQENIQSGSSEKKELTERQIPLRKTVPVTAPHNAKSATTKSKDQSKIADELVSSEIRKGFIPSVTKHGFSKSDGSKRPPFSPPPTMAELRSLTKKIGRFYTVNKDPSPPPSNRNSAKQNVILDIEKALSGKDVHGLEKCYRRIFNGQSAPVRTLVQNQLLPNQRSRQASYPLESVSPSSTASVSSYTRSRDTSSQPSQRRWSLDSSPERRLPFVPVPYMRHETRSTPVKSNRSKYNGDRPVMFSTTNYDHRARAKPSASAPAILTLDPSQFPQLPKNNPQDIPLTPSPRSNAHKNSNKKQLVYKSSSMWNQRAPNSTPEPSIRAINEESDTRRNIALHIATSQFHKGNPHGHSQGEAKRGGIRDDTKISGTQASNTVDDRREISQGFKNTIVTSGDIKTTYKDLKSDELHVVVKEAASAGTDARVRESFERSISPESLKASQSLEAGAIFDGTTRIETDQKEAAIISVEISTRADQKSPEKRSSSAEVSNIADQKESSGELRIEISDSSVDTDIQAQRGEEFRDVLEQRATDSSGTVEPEDKTNVLEYDSIDSLLSNTDMIETRIVDEDRALKEKMESVTVVVVNVTTDEGKDINADIDEYGAKINTAPDDVVEDREENSKLDNVETAKAAAKNRKEELEALLKEHSNIVETIKNLSADDG